MEKRIRERYEWNRAVYRQQTYRNSQTGEPFCLRHMTTQTFPFKYEFKQGSEKYKGSIDVKVVFDPHCYTSVKGDEDTRETLVTDHYNDGSTQERALDPERYRYSQNLVKVIQNLSHKMCRESRMFGKAIRLEERDRQNPMTGVYILMKLKRMPSGLTLYVETAHHRTNEPFDVKLKDKDERYMLILGRLLRDQWSDLVQ